jgi:hypothetical protein
MKRTPRKPRTAQDRDPLFNQSVEKAFLILEAFGGERRALNLSEVAAAVGMTRARRSAAPIPSSVSGISGAIRA